MRRLSKMTRPISVTRFLYLKVATNVGKQFTGSAKGQPDPAPAVNEAPAEGNNEMHCDIEASRVVFCF